MLSNEHVREALRERGFRVQEPTHDADCPHDCSCWQRGVQTQPDADLYEDE